MMLFFQMAQHAHIASSYILYIDLFIATPKLLFPVLQSSACSPNLSLIPVITFCPFHAVSGLVTCNTGSELIVSQCPPSQCENKQIRQKQQGH